MRSIFTALLADESGQGLVEYALIIALVAVGLIAILLVLRQFHWQRFQERGLATQRRDRRSHRTLTNA
jgi:Flp pilus assembly pilin Flp